MRHLSIIPYLLSLFIIGCSIFFNSQQSYIQAIHAALCAIFIALSTLYIEYRATEYRKEKERIAAKEIELEVRINKYKDQTQNNTDNN